MKILILISRLVGSFLVLRFAYKAYEAIENYDRNVFLAESAMQASQLSGEQLLIAVGNIALMVAVGIVMVVMEFIYLSSMMKDYTKSTEACTDIVTNTKIEEPDK